MTGVYAISRNLWKHPAFKKEPFTEREAWAWLIGEALFEPQCVRVGRKQYDLKRGQLMHSIAFLCDVWQWKSEARVRRYLGRLELMEMVCLQPSSEATTISVVNYDTWQFSRRAGDEPATSRRRQVEEGKKDNTRDDDGEARARASEGVGDGGKLISDSAFRITREVGKICGYAEPIDWPLGWAQAHYRVQTWLNAGWIEDQIIPACQAAMAGKRDGPPSTINYFDKPIAQWIARQAKPLPEVKIQERETISVVRQGPGGSVHAASRDFRAKLAEIQRPAPTAIANMQPGVRSGEGGPDVRLLPTRRCE